MGRRFQEFPKPCGLEDGFSLLDSGIVVQHGVSGWSVLIFLTPHLPNSPDGLPLDSFLVYLMPSVFPRTRETEIVAPI